MDWLITSFTFNGFMLNALVAGVLMSIACGIIGTFIVLAAGLRPTHLDWHALRIGGRTDIFDLMTRLEK